MSTSEATIFQLVELGKKEDLAERLEEEGSDDLKVRDEQGKTALDLAAILGRDEMAQLLMGRGAEVNLTNKSGENPLCQPKFN